MFFGGFIIRLIISRLKKLTWDFACLFSHQVLEGEVGPFASIKLPIVFTPTIPGENKLDIKISFSQPNCEAVRSIAKWVNFCCLVLTELNTIFFKYQDCGVVIRSGWECSCVGYQAKHGPEDLHVWSPLPRLHWSAKQVGQDSYIFGAVIYVWWPGKPLHGEIVHKCQLVIFDNHVSLLFARLITVCSYICGKIIAE